MRRRKKKQVSVSDYGADSPMYGQHLYTVICQGFDADETVRDAEKTALGVLQTKGYQRSELTRRIYFDDYQGVRRTVWSWYLDN